MMPRYERYDTWPLLGRLAAAFAFCTLALPVSAVHAADCTGPLTGPTVRVSADILGFGTVQGLPPLPLGKGQYVVTIDDGPNPKSTPQLLDALAKYCVKATFFLVGRNAEAHPDLVQRILANGHTVGSHTYSHPDLSKLSPEEIEDQMKKGAEAVKTAAVGAPGEPPSLRLFRFPGSSGFPPVVPRPLADMVAADGFSIAGYDFSPQDWRNSPPAESYKRLFSGLKDSGVIVFHDGQANTIPLLPMVFDEFRRRNNRIVALKP